jgi:hypothetical protein
MANTLDNVEKWMTSNTLKMNCNKTEVTLFGSRYFLDKISTSFIKVGNVQVKAEPMLKHLGVWLDDTLTFKHHIKVKCQVAASNIRKISMIRAYIDINSAKQLASGLVLSHLDYSNSVLCGLPNTSIDMLQRIQNWAAKVVLRWSKLDSSSQALKYLHWLPIRERIDYKIACLVFKCLERSAPETLSDLIVPRQYTRATRASTTTNRQLVVPSVHKATFAARSFSVYGPQVWNSLPASLRNQLDYKIFKRSLKTFLFNRAFNN